MASIREEHRNPACMRRFTKLEKKVFNGFEAKLDVVKEKVAGLEKLTYAVFVGIILTLAAAIARFVFKV